MELLEEKRSARKRRAIREAAASAFLQKGYGGTNMDEIAALAGVSKRTVYQHFSDKESLFREIVLATTDEVDALVQLVAHGLGNTQDVEADLRKIARRLLSALMEPDLLRLRRLVIANADRFPDLGRSWYERGFGRVLATMAERLEQLATRGVLEIDDAVLAANNFAGLLLWIPMNEAMFTGDSDRRSGARLHRLADTAVSTFLRSYQPRKRDT